jgi:hypothetical protein
MGAVVWMKPTQFRRLAHAAERGGDARKIEGLLRGGNAMGCPFLDMKEVQNDAGETIAVKVMGHEGRARADAFKAINGTDMLMPVHMFFRGGVRARDLKPELFQFMEEHGITPEGSDTPIRAGIERVFVAGKILKV